MSTHSHDTSRLAICPGCFEVYGSVPVDAVRYPQLCSCRSRKARQEVKPAPRYDYATYVELCRACGIEAIGSGSKWSGFFCPECHEVIIHLNKTLGVTLIPIGRHSIMNSLSLSGEESADPHKIDSFVKGLRSLWFRMEALNDWRRLMVARRCAELGFHRDKPARLDDFLSKAEGVDREEIRSASRRKLFAFFEVPEAFIGQDLSRTTSMN